MTARWRDEAGSLTLELVILAPAKSCSSWPWRSPGSP